MLAAPQQPQTPPPPRQPTTIISNVTPQPNIVTPSGTSAAPKIILNPTPDGTTPGK